MRKIQISALDEQNNLVNDVIITINNTKIYHSPSGYIQIDIDEEEHYTLTVQHIKGLYAPIYDITKNIFTIEGLAKSDFSNTLSPFLNFDPQIGYGIIFGKSQESFQMKMQKRKVFNVQVFATYITTNTPIKNFCVELSGDEIYESSAPNFDFCTIKVAEHQAYDLKIFPKKKDDQGSFFYWFHEYAKEHKHDALDIYRIESRKINNNDINCIIFKCQMVTFPVLYELCGEIHGAPFALCTKKQENKDFWSEITGSSYKPIDLEFANIASRVYNPDSTRKDGWFRIKDDDLTNVFGSIGSYIDQIHYAPSLPDSGFESHFYTDGRGRYVLVFAGTNPKSGADWFTNIAQGAGFEPAQYELAYKVAKIGLERLGKAMVVVGHSLGGGLASAVSVQLGIPAVTFNAAGVHKTTMSRYNKNNQWETNYHLIRQYNIYGEFLSYAQGALPIPKAAGNIITLTDPSHEDNALSRINFIEVLKDTLTLKEQLYRVKIHSMETMILALEKYGAQHK